MASLDEERFLRHIWLLGEGGLFVLRGVVVREGTKNGSTLDSHLQKGRRLFKDVLQEQQKCLFPTPTTVNADTNTWDMSLLFVVLKKLFLSGLSLAERASLSALKSYRNDFQGHPQTLSMNASDYSSNRQLLEQALRQIASGINRNVEIEGIIKRTATGRIDSDVIFTFIKEIHDFKTSFLSAIEDIMQRVNMVNANVFSVQERQELILQKLTDLQIKHLREMKHKYSRELEIIIQAECDNKEKKRKANDLLFDFVKIIQSDSTIDSDKIRRIIALRVKWYGEITLQLLDDLIEWFSDIEDLRGRVGEPRLGSIILPVFCSSVTGILTLLKYMNDSECKQHLSRITSTFSGLLGFSCSLSLKVEPMSLRSALSSNLLCPGKEKRSKEEKDLVLPINVTDREQVTDILEIFGGAETSCNMEKMSATLSQMFGETICLQTYADNEQLRSIVYERGEIESQPDKSTDDQSSDKDHKKQIQRTFSSFDNIAGKQELILQKITDLERKHLQKVKDSFSRELEIIKHAVCDNKEQQKKANDLLFDFVKIIQSDDAFSGDEIRRIITQRVEWYGEITLQLLDDLIEWFSDIEDVSGRVGKPRLGSIILPISCSSVTGILTLLKYMNGDQSKQRLSRISSTVSVLLGFQCSLSWKVEFVSLRSALSSNLLCPGKEKRSKEEKDLVLPINVIDIEQLTEMIGRAEGSSNMEKISATLSQIFGETICLKTYAGNDQLRGIVYERGYIESQPDKSTDDQSSDKHHKNQIQRKFSSSDSDEDVSIVKDISKKDEVNWVKSVLVLKIAADDAMTCLTRSTFKHFFDSLTFSEKNNLQYVLVIAQRRHKHYLLRRMKDPLEWDVNEPECRSLLKKLVSAQWKPANLGWDNIGDVNMDSYWKIAQLYTPYGNKDSTCLVDTDMLAIFHLLRDLKW